MKRSRTLRILTPMAGLAALTVWHPWTPAASGFPNSRAAERRQVALLESNAAVHHEETRTKFVPILTLGSGIRVGLAQIAGPVSRVDEVKAVAQLATNWKKEARVNILVPVATEHIVSNVKRVPQVSVTGYGELKL
jgi:hypothetical protein